MSEDRALKTHEVAARLRVCSETILRWHRRGDLPGFRLGGTKHGRLRFWESVVEACVEAWSDGEATTAAPVREAPTTRSDAAEARLSFEVPTTPPQPTAASTEKETSDATR